MSLTGLDRQSLYVVAERVKGSGGQETAIKQVSAALLGLQFSILTPAFTGI